MFSRVYSDFIVIDFNFSSVYFYCCRVFVVIVIFIVKLPCNFIPYLPCFPIPSPPSQLILHKKVRYKEN